jgi:hypothetical protein
LDVDAFSKQFFVINKLDVYIILKLIAYSFFGIVIVASVIVILDQNSPDNKRRSDIFPLIYLLISVQDKIHIGSQFSTYLLMFPITAMLISLDYTFISLIVSQFDDYLEMNDYFENAKVLFDSLSIIVFIGFVLINRISCEMFKELNYDIYSNEMVFF